MNDNPFLHEELLIKVLDAMPSIVLIVDPDVRIYHMNSAAVEKIGKDEIISFKKRGGEALNCIHSLEAPEGCGRAEACKGCVIRNSVNMAVEGKCVVRKHARLELLKDGFVDESYFAVTTSPFEFNGQLFVLLSLEDISELIRLRGLLPICANCKKIRNDENYWEEIDAFISNHIEVDFTHSLCPKCVKKLYPELYEDE